MTMNRTTDTRKTSLRDRLETSVLAEDEKSLTPRKVFDILFGVFVDMEDALEERLGHTDKGMVNLGERIVAQETLTEGISKGQLGEVVRFVVGDNLGRPGGLPKELSSLSDAVRASNSRLDEMSQAINSMRRDRWWLGTAIGTLFVLAIVQLIA